ncbi:MAG: hypothetical protein M1812_003815 [Candelaria pacifica]|nr:MAG: hypothetical protein M1812_003815 [Candelaria pacifica]
MDDTYSINPPENTPSGHLLQKGSSISTSSTLVSQYVCRPDLNLLLLPGEIRNKIYRHLLCGNVIRMERRNLFKTRPSPSSPRAGNGPHLSILRVCRKTYDDALSLLYAENTLFYAHYTISNQPFNLFFPPPYLTLIKRVHFLVYSYSDWNEEKTDHEEVASMLRHFSAAGVELEYMQIDLVLKGHERDTGQTRHGYAARIPKDQIILTRSPFARVLLKLTNVKKIVIELGGRANFAKPLFEKLNLGLKSDGGVPGRVIEIRDNRNIRTGPGPIYVFQP